jgi:hypothetical protein
VCLTCTLPRLRILKSSGVTDSLSPSNIELQKRLLAYTSAQAWGADDVFERLVAELAPK